MKLDKWSVVPNEELKQNTLVKITQLFYYVYCYLIEITIGESTDLCLSMTFKVPIGRDFNTSDTSFTSTEVMFNLTSHDLVIDDLHAENETKSDFDSGLTQELKAAKTSVKEFSNQISEYKSSLYKTRTIGYSSISCLVLIIIIMLYSYTRCWNFVYSIFRESSTNDLVRSVMELRTVTSPDRIHADSVSNQNEERLFQSK